MSTTTLGLLRLCKLNFSKVHDYDHCDGDDDDDEDDDDGVDDWVRNKTTVLSWMVFPVKTTILPQWQF